MTAILNDWHVGKLDDTNYRIYDRYGYPIAKISRLDTGEDSQKAANLIAAAPDFLEVCKRLIAYRDSSGPLNFQLEKADDFIRLMRIAVEKVEGK